MLSTATIFDIQRFSVHDGPGIRTLVFFKGCPLRCEWCSNPESHSAARELSFSARRCIGCGSCVEACPRAAILLGEDRKARIDRERCIVCDECSEACCSGACVVTGQAMTVAQVLEQVSKDSIFYRLSGGGVTLGGGEVTTWSPFATELLAECKVAGIDTAIETCGYADWSRIRPLLKHTDLVLYDIKHMDPAVHLARTGAPNDKVLANFARVARSAKQIVARVPVVPGFNANKKAMRAIARFVATCGNPDATIELLPYHGLAAEKYGRLGRRYGLASVKPPSPETMALLAAVVEGEGVACRVGG